MPPRVVFFFFLNNPAPPEIYPLPLPAPLPITTGGCAPATPDATTAFRIGIDGNVAPIPAASPTLPQPDFPGINDVSSADRKSTRLNSSHVRISYAVFCLKKKNKR